MAKITQKDAIHHARNGVNAYYYQFPDIEDGTTTAYAEFSGEHGERTIGDRSRIYYVLEGNGEFVLNGEKFDIQKGDFIAVPPHSTYNLWPKEGEVVKVTLQMELFDINKLPK